jgi:Concanavalin A-like lectin/glucanases superfamily
VFRLRPGWWQAECNALDALGLNNGALQVAAGYGPGEVGTAFSFNSTSGTVIVPDAPSLRLTNQLTIEAWINSQRTNSGGTDQGIVSKVGGAVGNNGYDLTLSARNQLVALFNSPGQGWPGYEVGVLLPIVPGTWNHVAFTYDQSAMKLYFNGQPVATNVIGQAVISATSANLHISGDDNNHDYFDGLIDEASVYNRALSASEIAVIYQAGLGLNPCHRKLCRRWRPICLFRMSIIWSALLPSPVRHFRWHWPTANSTCPGPCRRRASVWKAAPI